MVKIKDKILWNTTMVKGFSDWVDLGRCARAQFDVRRRVPCIDNRDQLERKPRARDTTTFRNFAGEFSPVNGRKWNKITGENGRKDISISVCFRFDESFSTPTYVSGKHYCVLEGPREREKKKVCPSILSGCEIYVYTVHNVYIYIYLYDIIFFKYKKTFLCRSPKNPKNADSVNFGITPRMILLKYSRYFFVVFAFGIIFFHFDLFYCVVRKNNHRYQGTTAYSINFYLCSCYKQVGKPTDLLTQLYNDTTHCPPKL